MLVLSLLKCLLNRSHVVIFCCKIFLLLFYVVDYIFGRFAVCNCLCACVVVVLFFVSNVSSHFRMELFTLNGDSNNSDFVFLLLLALTIGTVTCVPNIDKYFRFWILPYFDYCLILQFMKRSKSEMEINNI